MRLKSREATHLGFHWVLIPVIAIAMTLWPTISTGLELLQKDPGDTLLNIYILEHAYQHFSGLHLLDAEQFWSPDFFWPLKGTLAWSDHLLGPSVIYGLFRSLLDPFQSYLCWLSATLWLNYIAIRQATKLISPQALPIWASIAALVTCFSPTITEQLGHPQLLSLFLIGPILWQCHRLINKNPRDFAFSDWLLLATWLLANGFFNIYIFVYACYGVLICTVIHLIHRIRSKCFEVRLGNQILFRTGLITACIALNLMIYIPYLQTLKTFGRRPNFEIINNLPKPGSWLFGSNHLLLPPPWTAETVNTNWVYGAEQELFPGWSLCILLAATIITAVCSRRNQNCSPGSLRIWLLALAAMVLLSLSIHNLSAWVIVNKLLPGASSLRASSRVGMIIVLFSAPAIALAAQQWHITTQKAYSRLAALLAVSGSFAGIWAIGQPAFSLTSWEKKTRTISGALTKSNCAVFWYEWTDQAPWAAQVMAMHAQLRTRIPTANGYSGQFPKENWPFTIGSGESAYHWIKSSNPGQYHKLRPISNADRWCIVSIDNTGNAATRKYDPLKTNNDPIISVSKPGEIVLVNQPISISSLHEQLYYNHPSSKRPNEWILIMRDGEGIPSQRGKYKIVSASESNSGKQPSILIVDRNAAEGIEYEWIIDAQTGFFLGQSVRTLPRN